MQGKKVTIEDVAARLGLAKSTVSKALSDATDINQETRERVLHCASAMGYHMKKRHAAPGGEQGSFRGAHRAPGAGGGFSRPL